MTTYEARPDRDEPNRWALAQLDTNCHARILAGNLSEEQARTFAAAFDLRAACAACAACAVQVDGDVDAMALVRVALAAAGVK